MHDGRSISKFYIFSVRFFLPHLPVFEIRATIYNCWNNTPKPSPSLPPMPLPQPHAGRCAHRRRSFLPCRRASPTPRVVPPCRRRCSVRAHAATAARVATGPPLPAPRPPASRLPTVVCRWDRLAWLPVLKRRRSWPERRHPRPPEKKKVGKKKIRLR